MVKSTGCYCLILLFLFSFINAGAQQPLITGNFTGYTFEKLVTQIEATTPYRFFYDKNETDSVTVNIIADGFTIQQLLEKLFAEVKFEYNIDPFNRIFVNKKYRIITTLSQKDLPALKTDLINTNTPLNEKRDDEKNKLKVYADNRVFEIGNKFLVGAVNSRLTGYIRESKTGEPIAGATIYLDSLAVIVTTDQYGYYSLSLPAGKHILKVNSIGMKDVRRQLIVYGSGQLDIDLQDEVISLKSVIVTSEKASNIKSLQMGNTKLNIKAIKQVPVVFGETDIVKVILTLPGITSAGEAANGFNVRGGATDQNLILFNGATIYNPSHLFGFFSAFNADVVKNIELYKSAIPEKFGGRLASVLDITMQDGNKKKWTGIAGIGPLTSKFTVEGPLKKDKTTLILGGRTTYSNWLLRSIPNTAYENSRAAFYDFNLNLVHAASQKNSWYVTGYISNDKFNLNNDTTFQYGNKNIVLKWKHIFNARLNMVMSAAYDDYQYKISSKENPVNGFKTGFNIRQFSFRSDFTYSSGNKHLITFGLNSIYYKLDPGYINPVSNQSLVKTKNLETEQALETALYFGDNYTVSSKLSFNAGIRYSIFNFLGPKNVFSYTPGVPRDTASITDTITYPSGKIIKTYHAPEFRIGLRYALNNNTSIKISFNSTQQYIHMLSNTVSISPTDIWKLSDANIKPQRGMQLSAGIYKNFKSNAIETSLEFYYKKIKNFLDYKGGAKLLLNEHIETDVVTTRGNAYGAELLIKKPSGRFNGWVSYAYSRTLLQLDDPIAGETINKGEYYPASFDRPHAINFISNYKFTHRYSVSVNFVYNTGRPVTLPVAVFNVGGSNALLYSQRNEYRIPDYIRADLSFTLDGNHKVKQKTHNSWSVGVYNLLARKNPYSVYFIQENGKIKGYQLSIFGTAIPFITYNIKF
jgi:CarboxypepD_reg-like domain/TonB-dependent Receptor Plug Domain